MYSRSRQVFFCVFGTVLEWYEFSIYLYMAPLISILFFNGQGSSSLLATFAVFAAGFIMRPFGAIIFGHFGDTVGRKTTLLISIFGMGLATLIMGLLPTYSYFGMVWLVICRLLQGLATGGETSGSLTILTELKTGRYSGFISSLGIFAPGFGMVLASLCYTIVSYCFNRAQLLTYAWRIPFLLAAIAAFVGYYFRQSVLESTSFLQLKSRQQLTKIPALLLLKSYYKLILLIIFIWAAPNALIYVNVAYIGNYNLLHHNITMHQLTILNILISVCYSLAILLFGVLTVFINRLKIALIAGLLILVSLYSLIDISMNGGLIQQFLCQSMIAVLLGANLAPLVEYSSRLFPVNIRYTGVAIWANFSASVFGGSAPLLCELMVKATGKPAAIAYFLVFFYAIALCCMLTLFRRHK